MYTCISRSSCRASQAVVAARTVAGISDCARLSCDVSDLTCCVCTYVYMYIHICVCTYVYMYICKR